MKSYKRVVKERYDKQRYDWKGIKSDIYATVNPIGFYGGFKVAQILSQFVLMVDSYNDSSEEIRICDCGCGDGVCTRLLSEFLGNPSQVYGIEYSKHKLQHCKNMNDSIQYEYADLTEGGKGLPFDVQFNGMTAFVVFMHFQSEKEIVNGLKNIYASLKKKGIFLWYEVNARSHWDGKKKNVDGWGFSTTEMDKYATSVGFKLLKEFKIYTRIPIVNKITLYLAKNIKNIWMLELMEKLPFKKNNNIRVYYKE